MGIWNPWKSSENMRKIAISTGARRISEPPTVVNDSHSSTKTFGIYFNLGCPLPSSSHHQDYYIFRIGDPNLNLHLPLASWEGSSSKPNFNTHNPGKKTHLMRDKSRPYEVANVLLAGFGFPNSMRDWTWKPETTIYCNWMMNQIFILGNGWKSPKIHIDNWFNNILSPW